MTQTSSRTLLMSLLTFVAACSGAPAASGPVPLSDRVDLIIENGRIIDGTGAAWFYGDLAITGDRITRITPRGMMRDGRARERIDVDGMVVAPGFIDIQSHSRGAFLDGDGRVVSKITQGITTEIMGEGGTNAPANRWTLSPNGEPDPETTARNTRFMGADGFNNWLEAMEAHGVSPNIGSFLGATTVRVYAKGMAQGAATPAELDTMRTIVRQAMEGGAFGIASALIYPPGNFASTDELVEVARAMAPYGGVYITHMRSEADQYLEAIREAVAIGQRADVPVEIYHLKAGGQRNWPKASAAVALIDSARAAGLDVQANMYPYVAGGTGLTACFPPWASADGKLLENLANRDVREKIKNEILHQTGDWENLCDLATPDGVLVLGVDEPANAHLSGKRLSDIARSLNKHWVDVAMDLVLSERQRVGTIYFMMSEDNVAMQMQQPWIKFGTDAGGFDPDSATGLTHPRAYGTFPRIMGHYVRDEGVLRLEDAVRKASSAVATRLQIHDRGLLREGMFADIVVFDPTTIDDRATFPEPHQTSVGMTHVFVNGVAVVRDSQHTNATPGRIVRGPGYQRP